MYVFGLVKIANERTKKKKEISKTDEIFNIRLFVTLTDDIKAY